MSKIISGKTILHNNLTNSTFIADELDEKVQLGTRANDQHIEWMGELDVLVEPNTNKVKKMESIIFDLYTGRKEDEEKLLREIEDLRL